MDLLLQAVTQDQDFQSTVDGIESHLKEQWVSGLTGSARHAYMAALYRVMRRPLLLITHHMSQAQKAWEDLQELVPKEEVFLYPSSDFVPAEMALVDPQTLGRRIEVLSHLSRGVSGIYIVPLTGLRKKFPPKEIFARSHIHLGVGMIHPMKSCIIQLVFAGYERVEQVEKKGEFSVRGSLIDLYPMNFTNPVRIDWFDEEIESIRPFAVLDQRSREQWKEVLIPPAQELLASPQDLYQASQRVKQLLVNGLHRVQDRSLKEKLITRIGRDIERLQEGIAFYGMDKWVDQIYPHSHSLFHYISPHTVVLLDEPTRMLEHIRHIEKEEAQQRVTLLERGEILPECHVLTPYEQILESPHQRIDLSLFPRKTTHPQVQRNVHVTWKSMQHFHGQMQVLKSEWERFLQAGYVVLFSASTTDRVERLERMLLENDIKTVRYTKGMPVSPGDSIVCVGTLQNGFEMPAARLVLITEREIFPQQTVRVKRQAKLDHVEKVKSYQDLSPGDYVVHVTHGIGRYLGIKTLCVGEMHKDYLHLQYAGNDTLYVPVEQIDLVQKFIGSEGKTPKVYSLGGSEWSRVKNKVRSSVQDIAEELIKLYAKRQEVKGFAFSQDTSYQKEFEAMFPYQETPDQLRTIEEIKADMEQGRPMDRLLCGDVGYGKTEVAIRAAFKAVMDNKQVAVLVPTTILAQQHYETFRERFADYPVQIQVLSRFRSQKEQKETIAALKGGTVDIVIATHRLLSKDVVFQDLGLLIIDEEQRFGVRHKERIKQLKHSIDVLALSATPIPRTLHMAMVGVRDLSVIETPPANRFPVQTYVMEYSLAVASEAIERELSRGGQVYFLHNRIHNISQVAEQIRSLVPTARVAIAHGQMNETELEDVMLRFLSREVDVLVSTTIIEAGVDIPNVNTLIICDADRMGLSQLYQLRGRVGRSNRIAYAYFTYHRDKVLTETAEKRLQAIREFTELGSGFKIAMRDLAIRGAGNLLGAEQHGHIASVGFDLYSQMLKEAIMELKGDKQEEKIPEPQIELNVDAYLPAEYIEDETQKIELYKKIRAATTIDQAVDVGKEIKDRFGAPPDAVGYLLSMTRIRALAISLGIETIKQMDTQIVLKFTSSGTPKGHLLLKAADRFPGRVLFSAGQTVGVTFKIKGMQVNEILEMIEQFLIEYDKDLVREGEGDYEIVE